MSESVENKKVATESTEEQKNTSKVKTQDYFWYMVAGAVILVAAIAAYAIYFNVIIDSRPGGATEWGAFGDFVGGIANPFLGFLTILLLVHSLRLQAKELRDSTEAVKQSAEELRLTRTIHEKQEKLIIRDSVRPQVQKEFDKRLDEMKARLSETFYQNISMKVVAASDGNLESAINLHGTAIARLSEAEVVFERQSRLCLAEMGQLVDSAVSLVSLLDSDILIYPILPKIAEIDVLMGQAKIDEPVVLQNMFFDRVRKAIDERSDEKAFPALQISGLSREAIEARYGKQWW